MQSINSRSKSIIWVVEQSEPQQKGCSKHASQSTMNSKTIALPFPPAWPKLRTRHHCSLSLPSKAAATPPPGLMSFLSLGHKGAIPITLLVLRLFGKEVLVRCRCIMYQRIRLKPFVLHLVWLILLIYRWTQLKVSYLMFHHTQKEIPSLPRTLTFISV